MNCNSIRIKGHTAYEHIRFIISVLLIAVAFIARPVAAAEDVPSSAEWIFEGKVTVFSNNYENDLTFIGIQVSREGVRHGFGLELSSNFSRVDDRGNASYEHIQVVAGIFLNSLVWSNYSTKIKGELATGLAFSGQQSVDGDSLGLVEPAASVYIEPRLVFQVRQKRWRLRPSFGVGYIAYAVSDSDVGFSALRLHLGFAF